MTRARFWCLATCLLLACAKDDEDTAENVCLQADEAVRLEAERHVACNVDDDCALYTVRLDCVSGCAVAVAMEGLSSVEVAAEDANATYCADAPCRITSTCVPGEAACRDRRCAFVADEP